jgi:regulatory protein
MAQTITALTLQKRNKERVNLFLDGEYAFSLSLDAVLRLRRGQCLSQSEIDTLRREDEILRAYQHALRLLGYRPRSQVEMTRSLGQKGYGAEAVSVALQRLADKRYIDDDAFARYWLQRRERSRPRGARAINYELRQKGVDRDIINQVLQELDEEASAWAAIEGKLARWSTLHQDEFRKKSMGFLTRRGFSYDVVRRTCQKAWERITASQDE